MFDGNAYGEGVNGNCYSEEMDLNGEYDSVKRSRQYRTPWRPWRGARVFKEKLDGNLMRQVVDERIKWLMERKQCK